MIWLTAYQKSLLNDLFGLGKHDDREWDGSEASLDDAEQDEIDERSAGDANGLG